MEMIEFKEIVELFLNTSIHEIKEEYKTPNINFEFGKDGFSLFKNIVKNPFIKSGYWTPNAKQEDIDFIISHSHDETLTIHVEDSIEFFTYLKDIVNEQIKLNYEYNLKMSVRSLALLILRHIWLRMGIEDVLNVSNFLRKQLEFIKNRTLDTYSNKKIDLLNGYDVFMKTYANPTWDESTRSMIFDIRGIDCSYELPHILFDIDSSKTCYIYAVQSSKQIKSKNIERNLYKINKNIDDVNVHPSKVYPVLFFINELKKKKITRIRIPSMQVLSYRYHEILSIRAIERMEYASKKIVEYPDDMSTQYNYKSAKDFYDRVYDKQDKISYLKTEELINLLYRVLEHDSNIEIVNEINVQGDYLDIRIK